MTPEEERALQRVNDWDWLCRTMGLSMGIDDKARALEAALDTDRALTADSLPYEAVLLDRYNRPEPEPAPGGTSEPLFADSDGDEPPPLQEG